MSRRGPLGIRVPLSRGLARASSAIVAATSVAFVLAVTAGDVFVHGDAATRVIASAVVLVVAGLGIVGGLALTAVGPWSARPAAAIAFALTGVSACVGYGLDLVGGTLATTMVLLASAWALVHHLLASPELGDEGR